MAIIYHIKNGKAWAWLSSAKAAAIGPLRTAPAAALSAVIIVVALPRNRVGPDYFVTEAKVLRHAVVTALKQKRS